MYWARVHSGNMCVFWSGSLLLLRVGDLRRADGANDEKVSTVALQNLDTSLCVCVCACPCLSGCVNGQIVERHCVSLY